MSIVLSPTNMALYRQCPLKFHARYVAKTIQWKESPQKARGTMVHERIETMITRPDKQVVLPDGVDQSFVGDIVSDLRRSAADDFASVKVEHELCVTRKFKPTTWWADDCYLRAKADVIVLRSPQGHAPILVADIKTGRRWDTDDFQLRLECLLVHILFDVDDVEYQYWYVDSGETHGGLVQFRGDLSPVEDIIETMVRMENAMKNNDFAPRRNRFCKWCEIAEDCRREHGVF